jgi:outer membrane protein TolC
VYGQLTQKPRGDREDAFSFSTFPSYSLGLALTVPLWDGGGSKAGAEAAEANAAELGLRMEGAQRERAEERERARLEAEHADKRRALAEQLLTVCKTRVDDAEAGYELGAMQFDQVQQARALMRRAETELVMAKVAHAAAVLRVTP